MDNQHRKISGYRELTETEIELMNKIKEKEREVLKLIKQVHEYNKAVVAYALDNPGTEEAKDIMDAESMRWCVTAKTDIEKGFMCLVRSVARPLNK